MNSHRSPRGAAQTVWAHTGSTVACLELPGPAEQVLPGVPWGHASDILTPAFWKSQCWFSTFEGRVPKDPRLGKSLAEEVAACLLGGFGIPAELGLAAFERIRQAGLLHRQAAPSYHDIYSILSTPLMRNGRQCKYRFPKQKSRLLCDALYMLSHSRPPNHDPHAFRQWFLQVPGFGPKTASWLTRNWLRTDAVAVIDIHIHRAGRVSGIFEENKSPQRHYYLLEERFLAFAQRLHEPASKLDAIIWRLMRRMGEVARRVGPLTA